MKQVIGFKCDYCHKIFSNKEKCYNHEKHHREIKKIINSSITPKHEEEYTYDTSCWYINPYVSYYKVINEKGERIDVNKKQGQEDKQFWKDLHLEQTPTDFAWAYECIVYGHNVRNGYIKKIAPNQEEAINFVRLKFTNWD